MHTPLIGSLAEKYNNGDVEGLIKKRYAMIRLVVETTCSSNANDTH